MKVEIQTSDVAALVRDYQAYGRAILRNAGLAVSTTTRQTGSAGRKYLRDKTAIKAARLRRRLFTTTRSASGTVWVGLRPWPAAYLEPLRPRGPNPEEQSSMPGSYAGRQGFFFRGAFVARMPSGHIGIFRREGKKRLPIREETVSAAALGLDGMGDYLLNIARATLDKEFARQMERAIR